MADTKKAASSVPTGEEELVSTAYALFEEYRTAYDQEWQRIDACEQLYRGDHWDAMDHEEGEPTPVTPIIHSTVESICADMMGRYPEALIRPESPDDDEIAQVVGALIRQNHDAAEYRTDYSKLVHDLLVDGYAVQEVGYDPTANHGIGAAFIRYVDSRNILFDPQAESVQDGRAVFKIQAKPIAYLEKRYPQHQGGFSKDAYELTEDSVVRFDQDKSILEIEYWWREFVPDGEDKGHWAVHMAKLAGRKLLEDSRTSKPEGYFSVGEYPFVVTPLFRRKGSVLGWGIVDIFGDQQKYSDKLDQITLINAAMAKSNTLLVDEGSGYDPDDLADWKKEVHTGTDGNGVKWFSTPPLPQYIIGLAAEMRAGIKEESGANDISRGNVGGGVTSAAAINALMESSNKRARVATDLMHEGFRKAVRYEIEIEREFNALPREVSYTDQNGQLQVGTFENAMLSRKTQLGNEVPIEFFISIKAQQESRFSIQAHNDLMIQMVQLQMLTPQQGLELMEFEGKDKVLQSVNAQSMQPDPAAMEQEQQAMQAEAEQAALEQQMAQLPAPEQAVS